ncbi:MAG: DNA internalization-related competence protein ComEC/Rec2 [Armatimonadota bacterium]|nr:DNA internalization-related competence protein ComEC/Rec2 [Armatimonadota bacterium]MDR7443138.1 DNA internalization-related competence protein ComEC/Rec2 [Armatimonadota bacterium]MDR7569591.1 DNA internalization-related competence protein ComEC/Rec2 [Armatimonadota bacterium]MDR7614645.1 DNA internalization-related competence protein ComEC/Rec2 [Armatimonadota bacterium]
MRRPLVWVSLAFAVGIGAAFVLGPPLEGVLVAGLGVALGGIPFFLSRPLLRSLAVLLLVGCAGAGLALLQRAPPGPWDAASLVGRRVGLVGLVAARPGPGRFVLAVEAAKGHPQVRGGRLLVRARSLPALEVGDRVRVVGEVDSLRGPRNPGEPEPEAWAARLRVRARLAADRVEVLRPGAGFRLLRWASLTRTRLREIYRQALPEPYGSVLSSLVLGTEVEDEGLLRAFREAGLSHVLVASGAQLAVVGGVLHFLLRRTPRWFRASAVLAGVLGFALVAGWEPSMARAAGMSAVAVAAQLLRRDPDALTGLGWAVLVLLAANPALILDVGFQLSVAATWGLVILAPPLAQRLIPLPRPLRNLVGATVGAQLAVLPLLLWHFGRIPLLAPVTNLVALPAVGVLVPAGLAAGILGAVWPPMGWLTAAFMEPLVAFVVSVARAASQLPGATIAFPASSGWAVALGLALLIAARAFRTLPRMETVAAGCAVGLAGCMALQAFQDLRPDPRLRVVFLDVGSGDSIVVRDPWGRTLVVDGGPDGRPLVRFLEREGVRRVEVVVLSHPHADHVAGLLPLLENFAVSAVVDAGYPHPAPPYQAFLRAVRKRGISYRRARRGMTVRISEDVVVRVLWPEDRFIGGRSPANENSVVIRLRYGERSVLLPGDVEGNAEAALVRSGEDLRADVLKVPHQGSRTSSTEEFLREVAPRFAVLSVGARNPFGHPHPQVLRRYAGLGVRVYRTDEDGAVTVITDGRRLWVETTRSR